MDIIALFTIDSTISKLVMALALGAFIGLRREIDMQREGSRSFVGFRTMPLIVMIGAVSTMIPAIPFLPLICLIGVLVFLSIAYFNGVFGLQLVGLTSEFATLIMFLVGVMVGSGQFVVAIFLTVIVGILTGFKSELHAFAQNISPKEWGGALQLIILSAIVLPFLPREPVDPWGVLVPFDIWLLVIFISGIGFVGYFLNKYIDAKKGLMLTSFLGSIVSSTAVTTALAIQAKKNTRAPKNIFVIALLVSVCTMLVRTIIAIVVIAPQTLRISLYVPLAMLVMAVLLLGWYIWHNKNQDGGVEITQELDSPFELLPALKFGALFIVVLLAVAFGKKYLGDYGVLITAFLSSLVDVDATVLSSIQTFRADGIGQMLAVQAITIAIIVNTFVKVGYVWFLSRHDVAKTNTVTVGLISLVGFIVFLFL